MTRQIQQILFFSIIALLSYAVIKYFFERKVKIKDQPFTKGYAIEKLEMIITDDSGKFIAMFKSPGLVRYTDNPMIFVDKPLFWSFDSGKKRWQVEAEKAEYDVSADIINFINKVEAKSIDLSPPSLLTAKDLRFNLKNKKATTENGILLQQGQLTMQGQVAQFDLQNNILEVNKNVKAIYIPVLNVW